MAGQDSGFLNVLSKNGIPFVSFPKFSIRTQQPD